MKAVDPIVAKRKDEHFNYLADIVSYMIPDKTTTIEAVGAEYVVTGANGKQIKVANEHLAGSVKAFLK